MVLGNSVAVKTSRSMTEERTGEVREKIKAAADVINSSTLTDAQTKAIKAIDTIEVSSRFTKSHTDLGGTMRFNTRELMDSSNKLAASSIYHDGMHNIRAALGATSYGPEEEKYLNGLQVQFLRSVGADSRDVNHVKNYDPYSPEALRRQLDPGR